MIDNVLRFLPLVLLGAAVPAIADQPLRVDITQGVGSALPIAIADTVGGIIPGAGDGKDIGLALAQIMRDDISGTGLYRLLTVQGEAPTAAGAALAPWQKAGAQALLVGRAKPIGNGQFSYACTLYDVFAAKVDASRTFTVPVVQWRRAAHKCADMAFQETTGDPGHFDTRIAFVAESGAKVGRTKRIAVMDYDGANPTYLTRGMELVAMPRFSPDTRSIVYMTYVRRQPKIMIHDLGAGSARAIDLPAGTVFSPRFSPDGGSLAFSLGVRGETEIYKVDLKSGAVTRLTTSPGFDTSPSFSPDGSRIVFESTRSGSQQLYVMAADGSNQTRISFGGGRYGSPAWSPRGDLIAFTRIGGDSFRIGTMRSDGTRERLLTDDWQDESPSWAPSGRAIAFLRTRRGEALPELWNTDISGRVQRRIKLTDGGSDPGWSGQRP